MSDFLYRASLAIVPPLFVGLSRLLKSTCRQEVIGAEHRDACLARGGLIATFWHYGIYYIIPQKTDRVGVAMVSASRDGEYVARALKYVNYDSVRGSRGPGKGGLKALLSMAPYLERGGVASIVADGSQGPERVVQPGSIILASRTGVPILPMGFAANRYHVFASWDRSIIPLPFATVLLGFGEPLFVPPGVRGEELEKYRLELELRLNTLYRKTWERFGREGH